MKKLSLILILFTLTFFKVSSQEITVFPGFWSEKYYQDNKQITKSQLVHLLSSNPQAMHHWNKSKSQLTTAYLFLGAQVGTLIWQFQNASNGKSQTTPLIANVACGTTAIIFALVSNTSKKKAILEYNSGFDKKRKEQTYLVPATEGIGFGLRF